MSKDVLSTVVRLLTEKVGAERYDLWFGTRTRFSLKGSHLLVETPNRFLQDWQRQHYRDAIEAACREAFSCREITAGSELIDSAAVAVEFRVNEALGNEQLPAVEATDRDAKHNEPATERQQQTIKSHCSTIAAAGCTSQGASQPAHIRKLPQDGPTDGGEILVVKSAGSTLRLVSTATVTSETSSPRRRFATLVDFVIGAGNRLAHTSAQVAAERPGTMTPLVLYGPHGTGKTHLLEGICSAARKQNPNLNCVYLSAEQFTTFYVGAARRRHAELSPEISGGRYSADRRSAVFDWKKGNAAGIVAYDGHGACARDGN